jgi:hypothetical protein
MVNDAVYLYFAVFQAQFIHHALHPYLAMAELHLSDWPLKHILMVGHGSPEDSADGLADTKDDDESEGSNDSVNNPIFSRESVALRIALAVVQIIFHNCCILIFVGCSFVALLKKVGAAGVTQLSASVRI